MATSSLPTLAIGARYESMADLRLACKHHALTNFFEFTPIKSDKIRYTIRCKNEACSWRLHASVVGSTSNVIVRTYENTHKCFGIVGNGHKNLSASFLAEKIQDKVRVNASYGGAAIKEDIFLDLGVTISKSKAYRAKELASITINGTYEESYESLPQYCVDLIATNPDTVAIVESKPSSVDANMREFSRMFVSFGAAGKGFAHCRPLLGLDGTHLKSKYKGILLAATGVDACGSLFPLAHAVVDAENIDNWDWFLKALHRIIEQHAPTFLVSGELSFLSDRQKGLLEGVHNNFPDSPHGYCLKHLAENFYKKFKNKELKSLLWKAASAVNLEEWNKAIDAMNGIDSSAFPWLEEHAHPEHWAEIFFAGRRYGHLTSNIAESLNSWLLEAREKPILPMFEQIRKQLMKWYAERRVNERNTIGLLVQEVTSKIMVRFYLTRLTEGLVQHACKAISHS